MKTKTESIIIMVSCIGMIFLLLIFLGFVIYSQYKAEKICMYELNGEVYEGYCTYRVNKTLIKYNLLDREEPQCYTKYMVNGIQCGKAYTSFGTVYAENCADGKSYVNPPNLTYREECK